METKSERQIQTEAIAKQLGIPETLMMGIVVPENLDVTTFLTGYKNDIDAVKNSLGKRPNTSKTTVTGSAQELEYASCLLGEYGIDGDAKVGETQLQFNRRMQNENQQK